MLKKIRHYNLVERGQVLAHKAASAGLVASGWFFVHPSAAAATIGFFTYRHYRHRASLAESLDHKFTRFADSHPHSPNLGKLAERLYEKSGLSAEDNPIYNSMPKHLQDENEDRTVKEQLEASRLRRTLNAFSYQTKKPGIMISERMLEILDDEEEYAVLAHEFAHSAADHHALRHLSSTLHSIANVTHLLGAGRQMIKAGFKAAFGVINGFNIGNFTFNGLFKKKEISPYSDDLDEQLDRAALRSTCKYAFNTAVMAGIGGLFSAPLAGSIAAAGGTLYATKMLAHSLDRCNEYHADRLAVEFDAKPLSLLSALRKIEILTELEKGPNTHEVSKAQRTRSLGAFFRSLTMSHPATEDRYNRLIEMAHEQGASDEDITNAMNPEIHISSSALFDDFVEIIDLSGKFPFPAVSGNGAASAAPFTDPNVG